MSHHIGIVACSPPGAAMCYQALTTHCREPAARLQVSLHAHDFNEYMNFINRNDWDGVARLMLSSASSLESIGAQLLIAPCNTIHAALDLVTPVSPVPWLHIAEEVARDATRAGVRKLAVLGTRATMEGTMYRKKLLAQGIVVAVPDEEAREEIDRIIFRELVRGIVSEPSRRYFAETMEQMQELGCDAVGLCCTELTMLLNKKETSLPVLDSTQILAVAALERVRAL